MIAPPRLRLLLALLLAWCVGMAAAAGLGLRLRDAAGGGGAEVTHVAADSPAARAGLQVGDLIREAGGRPIADAAALVEILKTQGAGQALPLTVERGGWRRQLLLAGESAAPSRPVIRPPRLGLRVADADAGGSAARITAVETGSPAANAGLAVGDLILEAQWRAIGGAADFAALVRSLDGATPLELRISRDGWRRTVRLAMGQTAPSSPSTVVPRAAAPHPPSAEKDPCGRGRVGIQIQDGTGHAGVVIDDVEPDGAAAGMLRRGDRILAIDGRNLSLASELLALIDATLPGQSLKLVVERDRAVMNLELRTGALSEFDCLLERGDQQLEAENWAEADRLYEAAIKLQPKHLAGWERMAQLLDKKGDLKAAIESEQHALAAVGEKASIHARIGWYQQRLGLADDARASSERALRLDGGNAAAHSTLASLAIPQGDWDTAILHLDQFLKVFPDAGAAWGDLGLALANAGRDEEALVAFQRSLALDSEQAVTRFNAGLNLRRLGREQEAVEHLNRAAELDSRGEIGRMARQMITPTTVEPVAGVVGDSVSARGDGRRASVAVGDFQVKAAKASQQIGDGLREMFLTSLHESGYFNVVERMDIQASLRNRRCPAQRWPDRAWSCRRVRWTWPTSWFTGSSRSSSRRRAAWRSRISCRRWACR